MIDVNNWLAVLATLFGAVFGSATTFLSQRATARETSREAEREAVRREERERRDADRLEQREKRERAAQRRDLLRQAVHALLDAAQDIDQVASHRQQDDRDHALVHKLWLTYHQLAVLAPQHLTNHAWDYAVVLNEVFWKGTPNGEPVWEVLQGPRDQFDRAAHVAMAE
ncbi:hypothetical protein BS329_41095 [Amycolatopsis coloradensis]|uniref:Uncharacterized protein n=1 Tax=Amycolatopsis coloradensis TaxID=76021 RepID=A0A1R0KDB1_9PSEU|nr:hypothetical protein [Amycolatopsis coloradensis]OLZ42885.1 hypothetical protein BS329_41095 [Amycolatopsis coloradensis]